MGFSHESRTTFLAAGDKPNSVTAGVQAIENRKVTFAWNAKRVGDALADQAINQKMSGKL